MIADMLGNEKLNPIVSELFIRGRKFCSSKIIRLNSTRYFVMKIPNKTELQQIVFNRSSDIDF